MLEFFKGHNREKLLRRTYYVAPCNQLNPIELYSLEKGYPQVCRKCGHKATYKVLLLSPKYEVEGDFGPAYFCHDCVPDINEVAASDKNYTDVLYGKSNK